MKLKTFEGREVEVSNLTLEVDRDRDKTKFYKIIGTYYDTHLNRAMIAYSYNREEILKKHWELLNKLLDEQVAT